MSGSVAVVTGASSGIGKATALRLARDFENLVIVARCGDQLADVAKQIEAMGAHPLALEQDLMTPGAAKEVIEATLDKFGRIDALLNVAGAVPGIDLFEMTDDQWSAAMELKFHAARRLTVHAWDPLKIAKGSVVFISGTAAVTPKPGAAAVGAINAAIEALAKAFAEQGIRDGVQVNSVSPGAIMTGRRIGMLEKTAASKGIGMAEAKQAFMEEASIARFGEPEEIAEVMAFAVSPSAKWMTGTVLRMDGGEVKSV